MATLPTISSLVNLSTTVAVARLADTSQPFIYITAILRAGTVTDVVTTGGTVSLGGAGPIGPVDFPSPIQCTSFTAQFLGQVAYYVLGGIAGEPSASATTTTTTTTTTPAPGFIVGILLLQAAILARTGDPAGTIAFATDTKNYYIFNGSIWFNFPDQQ